MILRMVRWVWGRLLPRQREGTFLRMVRCLHQRVCTHDQTVTFPGIPGLKMCVQCGLLSVPEGIGDVVLTLESVPGPEEGSPMTGNSVRKGARSRDYWCRLARNVRDEWLANTQTEGGE